jgi:hypothetical protein
VGGRADGPLLYVRAQVYTEDIEEQIMAHEELVQSVDIASFTKV